MEARARIAVETRMRVAGEDAASVTNPSRCLDTIYQVIYDLAIIIYDGRDMQRLVTGAGAAFGVVAGLGRTVRRRTEQADERTAGVD